MNSIKTRMLWSYFLLIVLVVSVLGTLFITLIWDYYYGSAKSTLWQRAKIDIELNDHSSFGAMIMRDKAGYMVEEMAQGPFRLQLLDFKGRLQMDLDGLRGGGTLSTPDVEAAKNGEMKAWQGNDPFYNGERVASVTVPLFDGQQVTGLLRYSASLAQVDLMVWRIIRWTLITAAAVVLMFLGLSFWMAQRIVQPIRELTKAARAMAEGDWRPRAVPWRDEIGQLASTFNTLTTELTKQEKLKNDFISSISHELRTPLTSIKGWSETLAEPVTDSDEHDLGLSIIHRETDRLTGLVEDLLDFSNLYARRIQLHMEHLDLNGTAQESIGQLRVRQEKTGVKLVAVLSSSPLRVEGDANRLKQVLINLIDNAYKFTPRGGTIRVGTTIRDEGAILTVTDTGRGIDPEELPQVMEKFYKGASGQSGSGLGLAICKEIVELHGGALSIDSELNAGTTVTMMLPLSKQKK